MRRKSLIWFVALAMAFMPCSKLVTAIAKAADAGPAIHTGILGAAHQAASDLAADTEPACNKPCTGISGILPRAQDVIAPSGQTDPKFALHHDIDVVSPSAPRLSDRGPRSPPAARLWFSYREFRAATSRILT